MAPRAWSTAVAVIIALPGCDLVFGLDTVPAVDTGPDPACVAPPRTTAGASWATAPDQPSSVTDVAVTFNDSIAYTNVALEACEPTSATLVTDSSANVTGSYIYTFAPIRLPAGVTQLQFHADPGDTLIATFLVTVD